MNKRCSKCKVLKSFDKFRLRNEENRRLELRSYCRSCENEVYKQWYSKNKERRKVYKQQEWYKESSREYAKEYRDTNPEKRVFWQRRREVAKLNNGGSHSLQEWKLLKELNHNSCLACGTKEPQIKLTEDHIIPISLGGSDSIENIQPLCRSCNSSKKQKIIKYKTYATA